MQIFSVDSSFFGQIVMRELFGVDSAERQRQGALN